MNKKGNWYIIQPDEGHCQILEYLDETPTETVKSWGPFTSHEDAIAHRVGLIRAGKCQPQ